MAMVGIAKTPPAWKIAVSNSFVKLLQHWDFNESDYGFCCPQPIEVGHLVQFVASASESPILQVVDKEWREPEGKMFWVNFFYDEEEGVTA